MATATKLTGSGFAPGYGAVTGKRKKYDPWGGAAPGTSMGPGSTTALKAIQAMYPTPPANPGSASTPKVQTPATNALPVDPVYTNQLGINQQSHDKGIAALEGQKTSTLSDYGYSGQFDPTTHQLVAGSLRVDPNNPYSKAAQLQRSYDNAKRGTTNGLAARGQLYSGAMANAQNSNDRDLLQGRNTLEGSLGSILASLATQQGDLDTGLLTNNNSALGDSIGRASANPPPPAGSSTSTPTTFSSRIDSPPEGSSVADKLKLLERYGAVNEYTNSNGHKVRTFGDGHKEVFVNGQWQWVPK